MTIDHISDTARWVAVYRAMESERPDALFHDPYARRLAGEKGESIVRTMRRGRSSAWAMIVRTKAFDELILDMVARHDVDLVVNLAAGLDARPWRLPLPPTLRWADVDFDDILAYKRDVIGDAAPACRYETIPADLTTAEARRALVSRLGADARTALVVTEGLLIYLTAEQVAALASDLHTAPSFHWWLIDLASPRLLRIMERYWGHDVQRGNAPFRFGPAEGTEFFRPYGWREVEFRSTMEEARRLDREMPGMWFWRLLSKLPASAKRREEMRRMSSFVMLERL